MTMIIIYLVLYHFGVIQTYEQTVLYFIVAGSTKIAYDLQRWWMR